MRRLTWQLCFVLAHGQTKDGNWTEGRCRLEKVVTPLLASSSADGIQHEHVISFLQACCGLNPTRRLPPAQALCLPLLTTMPTADQRLWMTHTLSLSNGSAAHCVQLHSAMRLQLTKAAVASLRNSRSSSAALRSAVNESLWRCLPPMPELPPKVGVSTAGEVSTSAQAMRSSATNGSTPRQSDSKRTHYGPAEQERGRREDRREDRNEGRRNSRSRDRGRGGSGPSRGQPDSGGRRRGENAAERESGVGDRRRARSNSRDNRRADSRSPLRESSKRQRW